VLRRRIIPIAFALAAAACAPDGPAGLGPDVRQELDRGRDVAVQWIAAGRSGSASTEAIVALGYLERLRLGLGSPFRLADFALQDPRLDDATRADLGWAILARTIDRAAYQVEDVALDRITFSGIDPRHAVGREHTRLIEGAIRESRDPRSGELAVRLAYAMSAAEGTISSRGPELATRAAALVRDREVARADALLLLRQAEESKADPLALLSRWRNERRFQVEAPLLAGLSPSAELAALDLAPRLARALRELPRRMDAARPRTSGPALSLLDDEAATRLDAAADTLDMPPQTPIVVAIQSMRRELVTATGLSAEEEQLRKRFVEHALSEERFAAAYARLPRRGPSEATPAIVALGAAVAMRAYAQESVWFPGSAGPSNRELEERFGIASIRFGPTVSPAWRPYYRRMLEVALTDLYRVLPSLDLRGLNVVFGRDAALGETTLALHDPRGRRLILPPSTAAGTIAHEVAHDLDWQVALKRYRVRGDYASDRAVRSRDGFAVRMSDLAGASLEPATREDPFASHGRRPAEVFARNVDWFVAVALAAEGRMNGYLTSVQDDVLTGYGTVQSPDISGAAGTALISILDEVAPVYPGTRERFLEGYGLNRAHTPFDLVRSILDQRDNPVEEVLPFAPSTVAAMRLAPVIQARVAGFAAIDAWMCRAPAAAYNRDLESARRNLVNEAVAARARGLALSQARAIAGDAGRRWMLHEFYGGPSPSAKLDDAMIETLHPIALVTEAIANADATVSNHNFDLANPPQRCATAPLR
jgi:hypothetical protein